MTNSKWNLDDHSIHVLVKMNNYEFDVDSVILSILMHF